MRKEPSMPARTIKARSFTIFVDGKRITIRHVDSKGKRCRVFVPDGVRIEPGIVNESTDEIENSNNESSNPSLRTT